MSDTDQLDADRRRPIGVGIVGLSASGGWAAGAHLPALAAVDGIELRALMASSEATARAAGAAYGVPAYTSVEQLAGDENVDLVVVAVKVPRHRELVLPALDAGVPVLTEWPLAVGLREAEEMEGAAGTTRTFVGLQGRSSPTFRWLADLVSEGAVGRVLSATVVASSTEWGTPVPERMVYTLDRELGATMLTIPFGHAIDLVSMVVGELQDVVATTATRRPQVPLGRTGRLVPMTAEDQIAISGTTADFGQPAASMARTVRPRLPCSTRSCARTISLSGSGGATAMVSSPASAAAVRSVAACCLATAGKSSLPNSRRLTLLKSKGQNGMYGRSARLAYAATTASLPATAASRSALSDRDTSMMRSTPPLAYA